MIKINELAFSYDGKNNTIEDINLEFRKGEITGILGTNGSGKSTLIKCINGMMKSQAGSVLIDDEHITKLHRKEIAKKIAYVPQNEEASHSMVFDMVLLGRLPYIKWGITDFDKEVVLETLKKLNIEKFGNRYYDQLSGGEKQMVLLARALAQKPKFLLLDEPTSNLDPKNQQDMLSAVKKIAKKEDIGIVVVLHDLNLAYKFCDEFAFMKDGKVISYGDERIFSSQTIKEVYNIDVDIVEHKGGKFVIPV